MIIELTRGAVSVIDDEDFEEISKYHWHLSSKGYACRRFKEDGKWCNTYIHRQLTGLTHHDKLIVDHIDGDKLNNRRSNLRVCTNAENMRNRCQQINNTSGYKGVTFDVDCPLRPWRAIIYVNGKKIRIGWYATPQEAHQAYCKAALELHGEFANFGRIPEVDHAE